LQLHYYVSDYNESLILQAGHSVEDFLKMVARDTVDNAKRNLNEAR
jgi:ribosome-interacting GTPase 1